MKTSGFTKALAISGAILVWLPIAATLVTAVIGTVAARQFRLDWLMPAELAPAVLAGGALLVWASYRAHSRRGLIGWGLAAAIALLVGSQVVAVVSGLASGETEPAGAVWFAVVAMMALYVAAVVELAIAGTLLARDVFRSGGACGAA